MTERSGRIQALTLGALMASCAPSSPPPVPPATPPPSQGAPAPPAPTDLDAGLACVFARGSCEFAACAIEIHDECARSIACEAVAVAECRDGTGTQSVRAQERAAVPLDSATTLAVNVDCGGREVVAARIETLRCK